MLRMPVVALDQSAAMLERARHKLEIDPVLAARIELLVGEAESLPFGDGAFDHLTFTYLLRYVDDPVAPRGARWDARLEIPARG